MHTSTVHTHSNIRHTLMLPMSNIEYQANEFNNRSSDLLITPYSIRPTNNTPTPSVTQHKTQPNVISTNNNNNSISSFQLSGLAEDNSTINSLSGSNYNIQAIPLAPMPSQSPLDNSNPLSNNMSSLEATNNPTSIHSTLTQQATLFTKPPNVRTSLTNDIFIDTPLCQTQPSSKVPIPSIPIPISTSVPTSLKYNHSEIIQYKDPPTFIKQTSVNPQSLKTSKPTTTTIFYQSENNLKYSKPHTVSSTSNNLKSNNASSIKPSITTTPKYPTLPSIRNVPLKPLLPISLKPSSMIKSIELLRPNSESSTTSTTKYTKVLQNSTNQPNANNPTSLKNPPVIYKSPTPRILSSNPSIRPHQNQHPNMPNVTHQKNSVNSNTSQCLSKNNPNQRYNPLPMANNSLRDISKITLNPSSEIKKKGNSDVPTTNRIPSNNISPHTITVDFNSKQRLKGNSKCTFSELENLVSLHGSSHALSSEPSNYSNDVKEKLAKILQSRSSSQSNSSIQHSPHIQLPIPNQDYHQNIATSDMDISWNDSNEPLQKPVSNRIDIKNLENKSLNASSTTEVKLTSSSSSLPTIPNIPDQTRMKLISPLAIQRRMTKEINERVKRARLEGQKPSMTENIFSTQSNMQPPNISLRNPNINRTNHRPSNMKQNSETTIPCNNPTIEPSQYCESEILSSTQVSAHSPEVLQSLENSGHSMDLSTDSPGHQQINIQPSESPKNNTESSTIQIPPDPPIVGPRRRLASPWIGLLQNSNKYSNISPVSVSTEMLTPTDPSYSSNNPRLFKRKFAFLDPRQSIEEESSTC